MLSNHLILCRPLLLLPSIFPRIRVFSNESILRIRRPKYWSFSFNISPSNEHPGLISFRMDWFDLLAVQGTLRVFSNTTVQKHQFYAQALFIVQLSYPYMTIGKKHVLVIVNRAAMNIGVHVSFSILVSSGYVPGISESYDSLIPSF